MAMPTVKVPVNKVVVVTDRRVQGVIGTCLVCGSTGLLKKPYYHGQPAHSNDGFERSLIHKDDCPMNDYIDTKGNLIED